MALTRRQSLGRLGVGLLLPLQQTFGQALALMPSLKTTRNEQNHPDQVRKISSRHELFVDDWLIEKISEADLRLHHPIPREIAIVFDKPWEGNGSAYVTVFQDGDRFRMYYRGARGSYETKKGTEEVTCYAESNDGVYWSKPELNLVQFEGSTRNNIVWRGAGTHNFTPFKDTNPECKPEGQYKALGSSKDPSGALLAFQSPDGIHWSLMRPEPIIVNGAFDSQNLSFWDSVQERYVEFHRGFREKVRDVMTSTSKDFLHWSEPQWLDYGESPREHLYTNAITPYFRAPHLLLGFPMRYLPSRKKVPDHPESGISDAVFMTSRDGLDWHRWGDAFIRPGLQQERWWQRNNMIAAGMLVTKNGTAGLPNEISLYCSEDFDSHRMDGSGRLRRFTLRMDGFVSVHASYSGGEFVTHPLLFEGSQLFLNYSTSAAGSIRFGMIDRHGKPIPGFDLKDCPDLYGDEIEKVLDWDLSGIAGQTVQLHFVLKDADLYSLRFRRQ